MKRVLLGLRLKQSDACMIYKLVTSNRNFKCAFSDLGKINIPYSIELSMWPGRNYCCS